MNLILSNMLGKYGEINDSVTAKNAVKQAMQEIALYGLSKSNFFSVAIFYGGTALRIFHGLTRFSEDLDFMLLKPDLSFSFSPYLKSVNDGFNSLNIPAEFGIDNEGGEIKRGYIKGNAREVLEAFEISEQIVSKIAKNEVIKIKIEVDSNSALGATYETKFALLPYPHQIRVADIPSLFSGKLHAVLCRNWKERLKGRDLFDYQYYLTISAKPNFNFLEAKLDRTGYEYSKPIDSDELKRILLNRFSEIDFKLASEDVLPFIKDTRLIDIWSEEFFRQITIAQNF